MKSLVNVDPELPPPPYTWLIFTVFGGGGAWIVSEMFALTLRPCASVTVMGNDFAPVEVPLATAMLKEKVLSPLVTSPLVPLSKNCCDVEPPMVCKSPATFNPVLVGFVPAVTRTVSNVLPPTCRLLGVAATTAVGGVESGSTVSVMDVLPLRLCASVIVTGKTFPVAEVPAGTVARKE